MPVEEDDAVRIAKVIDETMGFENKRLSRSRLLAIAKHALSESDGIHLRNSQFRLFSNVSDYLSQLTWGPDDVSSKQISSE